MKKAFPRLVFVVGMLGVAVSPLAFPPTAQAAGGAVCQNVQGTVCLWEGTVRGCIDLRTQDTGSCTCISGHWDCGL